MATTRITQLSVTTAEVVPAITRLTSVSVTTFAETPPSSGVFYLASDNTLQPYVLLTIDDLPLD